MVVDLDKAKKEFLRYTEKYDLENENIELKQQHSLRVMSISKEIARRLNLEKEEVDIATLIGLLHDIARFEQYTKFYTFKDLQSFDHGDYGVEILNKDMRKYIDTDKYDTIIKKAIKNHNKYQIEKGLTEKEEQFAKIIRDADKIDIFYESVEMFWKGKENQINNSKLSERVIEKFENREMIKRKKNSSNIQTVDDVIGIIAFIFDINFKESFEILKEEDYINKILDRFNFENIETRNKVEEMRKLANMYVEKVVKE